MTFLILLSVGMYFMEYHLLIKKGKTKKQCRKEAFNEALPWLIRLWLIAGAWFILFALF